MSSKSQSWGRIAGLCLLVLLLAACGRKATPPPTATPVPLDNLPDRDAVILIKPDQGGTVGLRDGAEMAIPRGALTDNTLVSLRSLSDVPPTPIPRSIIGRAYDVSFDGGDLTGIGMLSLPLPANVTPDQYELAAYRWDGKQWHRLESRYSQGRLRLGTSSPGTYAILGNWRMADADLTLAAPPADPGSEAIPIEAHGQYRYTVLPSVQHDYIEARLALKRDSSGGAGQVTGITQLDQTVAETVLWFKPDPAQSQGVIDFTYTFHVDPIALDVPLGSINRFYADLNVADSPAPTRRLSTGVDYTASIPIKAVGTDVVRPELSNSQQPLLWHVRLNGQTLFRRPATGLTLSLAEVLAQGGLGEYKITVDAEYQGNYMPVSNEVTVQLAVPNTATPVAIARNEVTPALIPTATVWPFGTMPPTPTRRPQPAGTPSPLEGPTRPVTGTLAPNPSGATATPTPTPTRSGSAGSDTFYAEQGVLVQGECTTLHWNVENVSEVYFNGNGTTGSNSQAVCPTQSTGYLLHTIDEQGRSRDYTTTVTVHSGVNAVDATFTVDQYQIVSGSCTTLRWKTSNVEAVFLDDAGVGGEASKEVCPTKNPTTYTLRVRGPDGDTKRYQTVYVLPADSIVIRFWADQYLLHPNACTTLHWVVQDVDGVFFKENGVETGVEGIKSKEVCPKGEQTYTLTAKVGDRTDHKDITLQAADVAPRAQELIAQGIVTEVTEMSDIDSKNPGSRAGFRIVVDGITSLANSVDGCCQSTMTLLLTKPVAETLYPSYVDWPIHEGQQIEFRLAPCNSSSCTILDPAQLPLYLRQRSQ
jgi:hypothetical protein